MKHMQRSPFPLVIPNGKVVIGELCYCGHFRSEHHDTIAYGHANCSQCECSKYTFQAFVLGTRKEMLNAKAKAKAQ